MKPKSNLKVNNSRRESVSNIRGLVLLFPLHRSHQTPTNSFSFFCAQLLLITVQFAFLQLTKFKNQIPFDLLRTKILLYLTFKWSTSKVVLTYQNQLQAFWDFFQHLKGSAGTPETFHRYWEEMCVSLPPKWDCFGGSKLKYDHVALCSGIRNALNEPSTQWARWFSRRMSFRTLYGKKFNKPARTS